MDENRNDLDRTDPGNRESLPMDSPKHTSRRNRDRFGAGVLAGVTGAVVLFVAVLGIRNFFTGTIPGSDLGASGTSAKSVEKKLDVIDNLIEEYYLYEDDIDGDALVEGLYSGYTEALGDPYTEYYDEEETKALFESTSGEFTGIGVTMSQGTDGTITVTNIYKDSQIGRASCRERV